MRVLHVLDYSPPFRGGFHEMLLALGEGMQAHGRHAIFGFPFHRDWFADFSRSADALSIAEIRRPVRSGFAAAIEGLCRAHRVDLLHLHFSFALPFALALSSGHRRLPVVYHWHNPPKALMAGKDDGRSLRRSCRPLARTAASAVARFTDRRAITGHLAVSREIRDLLVQHRWADEAKVVVLPNAILPARDPSEDRVRPSHAGFVVGCVANFRPQKDHPTLIRAFRRVARECPGSRLILVGDGPCRAQVEGMVARLGLGDRVEFAGFADDPSRWYRRFDLFALSSHFEGQSMVLLEAMNHALPVVATRVGGTPDSIRDGVDGLLVPRTDTEALAAAMVRLAQDPNLRRAMGASGCRRVRREFSTEVWVERLLGVYESILDGRSLFAA